MRWPRCKFSRRALLLLALAATVDVAQRHGPLHAAEPQTILQLAVVINGFPVNMISSFIMFPGGMIGATRSDLESLGLRSEAARAPADMVMLNEIPTLKYSYEERKQEIRITVDDAYLLPHVFDLHGTSGAGRASPQAGWGVVLNYDLFESLNREPVSQLFAFRGASLTLDMRAFSPFGTFTQSAIVSSVANSGTQVVRLNSFYRVSDYDRLISWTVGDTINGGLSWTRPIRIGGMQAQRSFLLRPDLITMPLPNLGGSAAVPSTVDVYVNNTRTFSQDIGSGPYMLTNIPMVTGAGNAEVVVRDASGHETATSVPFYGSAALLVPGLSSWSMETGLPRLYLRIDSRRLRRRTRRVSDLATGHRGLVHRGRPCRGRERRRKWRNRRRCKDRGDRGRQHRRRGQQDGERQRHADRRLIRDEHIAYQYQSEYAAHLWRL